MALSANMFGADPRFSARPETSTRRDFGGHLGLGQAPERHGPWVAPADIFARSDQTAALFGDGGLTLTETKRSFQGRTADRTQPVYPGSNARWKGRNTNFHTGRSQQLERDGLVTTQRREFAALPAVGSTGGTAAATLVRPRDSVINEGDRTRFPTARPHTTEHRQRYAPATAEAFASSRQSPARAEIGDGPIRGDHRSTSYITTTSTTHHATSAHHGARPATALIDRNHSSLPQGDVNDVYAASLASTARSAQLQAHDARFTPPPSKQEVQKLLQRSSFAERDYSHGPSFSETSRSFQHTGVDCRREPLGPSGGTNATSVAALPSDPGAPTSFGSSTTRSTFTRHSTTSTRAQAAVVPEAPRDAFFSTGPSLYQTSSSTQFRAYDDAPRYQRARGSTATNIAPWDGADRGSGGAEPHVVMCSTHRKDYGDTIQASHYHRPQRMTPRPSIGPAHHDPSYKTDFSTTTRHHHDLPEMPGRVVVDKLRNHRSSVPL